jgi:hypothetical protein
MKISATTALEAAKNLSIDFAAACAMSVVELHKAYTKAYNTCNRDTTKFWSNMIALRASNQL